MEKYKFLLKPIFYIFSLLFASWMVLMIEKLSPSDFGKYKSLFEIDTSLKKNRIILRKTELNKLVKDYKAGLIDSVRFDNELERVLEKIK